MCQCPVIHHCNKVWGRQMGDLTGSVLGMIHTASTVTHAMARFPYVFFAARTTSAHHSLLSFSITPFSSRRPNIFRINSDS